MGHIVQARFGFRQFFAPSGSTEGARLRKRLKGFLRLPQTLESGAFVLIESAVGGVRQDCSLSAFFSSGSRWFNFLFFAGLELGLLNFLQLKAVDVDALEALFFGKVLGVQLFLQILPGFDRAGRSSRAFLPDRRSGRAAPAERKALKSAGARSGRATSTRNAPSSCSVAKVTGWSFR